MALGSIQPLTEMSIRDVSGGMGIKAAGGVGLIILPHYVPIAQKSWEPHSPGAQRACPGLRRDGPNQLKFAVFCRLTPCSV
jgi:hypothetical protein